MRRVPGPYDIQHMILSAVTMFAYTLVEGTSRSNEETSTNRPSNCDHVQMARLQDVGQFNAIFLFLERFRRATHPRPEGQLLMGCDNLIAWAILRGICAGRFGKANIFLSSIHSDRG